MCFTRVLWSLLPPLVAAGCDAQRDTDYLGEPLATIIGTLSNEMTTPAPTRALVGLVWVNSARSSDLWVGEFVEARGHFPANFSIRLFAPPDDEVLNDYSHDGQYPDEGRIGMAYISVVVPNADGEVVLEPEVGDSEEAMSPFVGLAPEHVLAYAEADVRPGTFTELLVGPLKAGYHVLAFKQKSDEEVQKALDCQQGKPFRSEEWIACGLAAPDQFFEAPEGLNTRIRVKMVDDTNELEGPDLK